MRRIDCGTSGSSNPAHAVSWDDVKLDSVWRAVVDVFKPGASPRPAQVAALRDHRVLDSRRHLIIAAPTNAGKSLVGLLVLLDAVRRGGRALLIEPLRAIAREKAEDLQAVASQLSELLGRSISVRVSTGDYRLDEETFVTPPPASAELVIATPERVDAIMRNPDHDPWVNSIGAVCVDEAHLVSSPRRGPTLECVITSFLGLPAPPRLVLLSASLGDLDRASAWLAPCDVVRVTGREPPLRKEVWELGDADDANDVVVAFARDVLGDPSASMLVFVYQTRSAEHLGGLLQASLGPAAGEAGALAYHAQMSVVRREHVRSAFQAGRSRCVVTTTALGLGVNLPATHVIVRDAVFPGVGRLDAVDLLQMMGRAGRADRAGHAVVVVRPTDAWNAEELARELRRERLPDLTSAFDARGDGRRDRRQRAGDDVALTAPRVAALLARYPDAGVLEADLRAFFERSLGGSSVVPRLHGALAWLADPARLLAFRDDQRRYRLTALGLRATRTVLPLEIAAGFAQLIRDVLSIDTMDKLLARWRPLDHLILLELLSDRSLSLRPFSSALVEHVDVWMEKTPARTPLVYREWIAGQRGGSRAAEVLGSLGLPTRNEGDEDKAARRQAYLATFRALVLYERGQGVSVENLERRWGVMGLEGIEERWRDDHLWLLAGLAKILDLRCFYAHLREHCGADTERIHRVKGLLREMRNQAFELQEDLKYCSPLGPVLRGIRRTALAKNGPAIGVQTIRRLEEAGYRTVADLARLSVNDLVGAGVRRDRAESIRTYLRRRLQ